MKRKDSQYVSWVPATNKFHFTFLQMAVYCSCCICVVQSRNAFRDGPLEKWWGRAGGGGKDRKKIMQEGVTKKIIVQRRQIKKVLQSELHCRAYKLYPTKRHPGMQPLYTVVLVLVESPFTWFSIQSGKRTFFPGKVNTFSVQQPPHVQW